MENQKETTTPAKQETITPVKQDLHELIREAKQEAFNKQIEEQQNFNKSQIRK